MPTGSVPIVSWILEYMVFEKAGYFLGPPRPSTSKQTNGKMFLCLATNARKSMHANSVDLTEFSQYHSILKWRIFLLSMALSLIQNFCNIYCPIFSL